MEPHFQTSATMSRLLDARKLVSLSHTGSVVRAPKSPSPGGAFWDQKCSSSCGRATEYVVPVKNACRGASSRRLVHKLGEMTFFLWAVQHRCIRKEKPNDTPLVLAGGSPRGGMLKPSKTLFEETNFFT